MHSNPFARYASVQLAGVPKIDRFFPNCMLGIVELYSRTVWGVRDIKQVWFGNRISYQRPEGAAALSTKENALAGEMSVTDQVFETAFHRLEHDCGIHLERVVHPDVMALFDEVHESLRQGKPAVSAIDMSFLSTGFVFQPHMVAIVGWDREAQLLRVVEQVRGEITVPLDFYIQSFHRFAERGLKFELFRCSRPEGFPAFSLPRENIHQDIRLALENLLSREFGCGIHSLDLLAEDVKHVVHEREQAFRVPGLWIFSHDRHALLQNLPHWREVEVASAASLTKLESLLRVAFAQWFEIDMTIERSLVEKSAQRMRKVADALLAVKAVELSLADLLGSMVSV